MVVVVAEVARWMGNDMHHPGDRTRFIPRVLHATRDPWTDAATGREARRPSARRPSSPPPALLTSASRAAGAPRPPPAAAGAPRPASDLRRRPASDLRAAVHGGRPSPALRPRLPAPPVLRAPPPTSRRRPARPPPISTGEQNWACYQIKGTR